MKTVTIRKLEDGRYALIEHDLLGSGDADGWPDERDLGMPYGERWAAERARQELVDTDQIEA